MYIVGIDIAKRVHVACVINRDGEVIIKSIKVPNTVEGFDNFIAKLREISANFSEFEFGMEATGHYWLNIYTNLVELGCNVHVINPVQSDALRGLYIRKTKNDAKDSMIIADVIRFGRYRESVMAEPDLLEMRELTRQLCYPRRHCCY
jgi:transposase